MPVSPNSHLDKNEKCLIIMETLSGQKINSKRKTTGSVLCQKFKRNNLKMKRAVTIKVYL